MSVSGLLKDLLTKRGFTDEKAIDTFLNPDYVRDTHDPLLLEGMNRAVVRLLLADRKSTRLNSSHSDRSRRPSSA